MLKPVLVRANYKVTTSTLVTLENVLGANTPLLFPEVQIFHRTPTSCSLTVAGLRRVVYTNQVDADFNGTVTSQLFTTFAMSEGTSTKLTGLSNVAFSNAYSVTNEITLTNAGPAGTARVSLLIQGLIESSVTADPLIIVNV